MSCNVLSVPASSCILVKAIIKRQNCTLATEKCVSNCPTFWWELKYSKQTYKAIIVAKSAFSFFRLIFYLSSNIICFVQSVPKNYEHSIQHFTIYFGVWCVPEIVFHTWLKTRIYENEII